MPQTQVQLRSMTEARYQTWVEETIAGFAAQQVAAGAAPAPEAREYAERQFDVLLPDGLLTRDQHVWSAYDGSAEVGYLWVGVRERAGVRVGYVYDVAILPHLQGRGYGRAVMLAGEERLAGLGAVAVELNVFGHNTAAHGLYRSLDYATMATLMRKDLPSSSGQQGPAPGEGPTDR